MQQQEQKIAGIIVFILKGPLYANGNYLLDIYFKKIIIKKKNIPPLTRLTLIMGKILFQLLPW